MTGAWGTFGTGRFSGSIEELHSLPDSRNTGNCAQVKQLIAMIVR